MIDCSKTENYFAEKQRMTKEHRLHLNGHIYVKLLVTSAH